MKQPPNLLSVVQDNAPPSAASEKLVTSRSTPHGEDISALC